MVLAQERALAESMRAIDDSATQYLHHGMYSKENSSATLEREVETAHTALAQEMAFRDCGDHNLLIGLEGLHEKADIFKIKMDDITRCLWDEVEIHSQDACVDTVGVGDLVHETQLGFQQAAVPSFNPVQQVVVAEPAVTVQLSTKSVCAAKSLHTAKAERTVVTPPLSSRSDVSIDRSVALQPPHTGGSTHIAPMPVSMTRSFLAKLKDVV